MSNEITSILQTLTPQHKMPGQVRHAQGAQQPTTVEKPNLSQSDRITLTDSARLLQLAESRQGPRTAGPRLDVLDAGMTYAPKDTSVQSASNNAPAQEGAQKPSPAMANMMEAFLTTSDMKGFDVSSDLNADGIINFQDLAALRDIETGDSTGPSENPKTMLHNMTEAFFSSEGAKDFDPASDLSGDGVINFQDLAILRAKMEQSE